MTLRATESARTGLFNRGFFSKRDSSSFIQPLLTPTRRLSVPQNKQQRIVTALFTTLLISLAPITISFGLFGGAGPYALMVQAAAILQIVVLLAALRHQKLPFEFVGIAAIMAVVQCLSLLWIAGQGTPVDIADIANMIVRLLNQIVMFGLFYYVIITEKAFLRFMKAFVGLAVVASLYNLAVNFSSLHLFGTAAASHGVSFNSFFANRNQFGAFLLLALIALSYYTAKQRFSLLHLSFYILFLLNLVMSLSRAAIGGGLAFIAVLLVAKAFRSPARIFALTLALIAGAVVVLLNIEWFQTMTDYILRPDAGTSGRDLIWADGIRLWLENPLTGVGTFTGLALLGPEFGFNQFHSLYVDLLVDSGLLGLLFILALFAIAQFRAFSNEATQGFRTVIFAAVVGFAVLATFESVGFFSAGYSDTVFSVFFISMPLLLGNMTSHEDIT